MRKTVLRNVEFCDICGMEEELLFKCFICGREVCMDHKQDLINSKDTHSNLRYRMDRKKVCTDCVKFPEIMGWRRGMEYEMKRLEREYIKKLESVKALLISKGRVNTEKEEV